MVHSIINETIMHFFLGINDYVVLQILKRLHTIGIVHSTLDIRLYVLYIYQNCFGLWCWNNANCMYNALFYVTVLEFSVYITVLVFSVYITVLVFSVYIRCCYVTNHVNIIHTKKLKKPEIHINIYMTNKQRDVISAEE